MNTHLRIFVAGLAIAAAGYAGSVAAEDRTFVSDNGDVIHCASTQGRIDACGYSYTPTDYTVAPPRVTHCVPAAGDDRTYCGQVAVRFVVAGDARNPACVEGSTWGIDDGNLWVRGHCTVYF